MAEYPQTQIRTVTIRAAMKEAFELYHARKYDECRLLCLQLVEQKPNHANALHLLGVLEIERNELTKALPYFEKALSLNGGNAEFHSNHGTLLSKLKRNKDALEYLHKAIALKPDYADAHANLGSVLLDLGQFPEALDAFKRAISLHPASDFAFVGAGCAYKQLGQYPESIAAFREAMIRNHDNIESHCNMAMVLIQAGAFGEGWREYEWRMRSKHWGNRTFRQPRWDGKEFRKRNILIPCEQGLGDTIQFVRYLPELKKLGGKIVFESPPELKTLLAGIPGVDLQIDWPRSCDVESGVDCYVPLMSLPLYFTPTMESIPAPVPYLFAKPEVADRWKLRLNAPGMKVGLVWSGNPHNLKDYLRSCKLADFASLTEIRGITFYSLQKGPSAQQAANPPEGMKLIDLSEELTDFNETAGAISHLDLIITVDTAVAHLAGAMGKPVWTLLPYAPDWRWFLVREDSPWYPTMRLFRQEKCGDWAGVFRQVADSLRRWSIERPTPQVLRTPLPVTEIVRCLQHGDSGEAERLCRQILQEQPHHAEALNLLGSALFQAGQTEEAVMFLERATRINPGIAAYHFNLGIMLAKLGQRDDAAASYRRALAIEPQNPETRFNLANYCRDCEQYDQAVHHYEQAIAAKPDYHKARINLGNVLRRLSRCDEAIAQFQEILRHQPTNSKAHHNLAMAFKQKGDYQSAVAHARRAVELAPEAAEMADGLAGILEQLGQKEESAACRDRAASLRSNSTTSS